MPVEKERWGTPAPAGENHADSRFIGAETSIIVSITSTPHVAVALLSLHVRHRRTWSPARTRTEQEASGPQLRPHTECVRCPSRKSGGARSSWARTTRTGASSGPRGASSSPSPGATPPSATPAPPVSGYRVQGSGYRVQGSGFRVQGAEYMVQGSGFQEHHCLHHQERHLHSPHPHRLPE